jgi:predicted ArsR family transcriptional regulator
VTVVTLEQEVEALGVLIEPQRLRVYEHLLAEPTPPSLAQMATALGMGRTLLAFHLGKLVEAGFVQALAAEPGQGRRGRPSQHYRVTRREVSASVPARHYELIAQVLLEAAGGAGTAHEVARRRGTALAATAGHRSARTRTGLLAQVERLLSRLGYAPRRDGDEIVLANCPFDRLRETNLELVCSLNQALAEGYLEGLGAGEQLSAKLRPCADHCCVVVS